MQKEAGCSAGWLGAGRGVWDSSGPLLSPPGHTQHPQVKGLGHQDLSFTPCCHPPPAAFHLSQGSRSCKARAKPHVCKLNTGSFYHRVCTTCQHELCRAINCLRNEQRWRLLGGQTQDRRTQEGQPVDVRCLNHSSGPSPSAPGDPTPCTNQLTQQLISSHRLPALETLQAQLSGAGAVGATVQPARCVPSCVLTHTGVQLVPKTASRAPRGCWAGAAARVRIPAELQAGDPRLASRLIDVLDMKYLQAARAWDTIPYEILISPVNMNAIRMEWLG